MILFLGVQVGLDTGILCLRAHGTFLNIAIWEKPATISPNILTFSERKYQGIATYERGDFKEVLEAISKGLIKPEKMITKKVSLLFSLGMHYLFVDTNTDIGLQIKLDEILDQGFKALIEDKANQVKILVDPIN